MPLPPRPKSRSPSPAYRQRRYSPSRAVSPFPARRLDDDLSVKPMGMRRDSPPPLGRRHDDQGPSRDDQRARDWERDRERERDYDHERDRYRPRDDDRDREYDRGRYDYDRRYSPSPPRSRPRSWSRSRSRSPAPYKRQSPPHRARPGVADFYDTAPPPATPEPVERFQPRETWRPSLEDKVKQSTPPIHSRGMAADKEEARTPRIPRGPAAISEEQWERGRDISELDSSAYPGMSQDKDNNATRGQGPSPPSRDVIFLGLDPDLTESDFSSYLRLEHQAVLESVKIARDKHSGSSKFFGFAQFATLEGAEAFVSENCPHILMPALFEHSDPRKVKIDFSAALPTPVNPAPAAPAYTPMLPVLMPRHDSAKDIGTLGGGNRVLLLQGLDWTTKGEEIIRRMSFEIARMLGKTGREREAELAITRVVLIQDKNGTKRNWGFAFVEVVTSELVTALVPFLSTPVHQPRGFLVTGVPIAAFPANPSAFVPTPAGPLGGQYLVRAVSSGGIGCNTVDQIDGKRCAYWAEHAGAVQVVPRSRPPISEDGSAPAINTELRIFLGHLAGPPPAPVNAPTGPAQTAFAVANTPISLSAIGMQPIKIGLAKSAKVDSDGMTPLDIKNVLDDDEEAITLDKDSVLLSRTKGAHIVPPTSGSRKIAKNISKWNNKQTELATPVPTKASGPPGGLSSANAVIGVKRPATQPATTAAQAGPSIIRALSTPTNDDYDYTDISTFATIGKVACLLCQRQFKTEEVLKKHVAQSDLHKTNLLDGATCEAGQRRKAATSTPVASTEDDEMPKYQDRAAMRREAFNQPDKPSQQAILAMAHKPPQNLKRKFVDGPKPPPPLPEAGPAPGVDDSNVGNQLLAKMGWTAGTGLGVGSGGRVDPIAVQQFENRAGLGASKGKEAGRWDGQAGFQQRALDMAKARYDRGT